MISHERLSDLDELVLRCRTEQAREYVSEAVACYRAGAYRACIVNTWVAVVFDLIDKMRELSVSGDKVAEVLVKQFETYQQQIDEGSEQGVKNALAFERNILGVVREKLQLLDQQQYLDLCRLREDRHRCAHPSFQRVEDPYRPTAELARVHLRNAIVQVLQQQPVQGKAALTELRALVSSQYFPRDPLKALTQLKNSALGRPNDVLVRGFVDLLIFGFFEDDQPLKFSHQVVPALKAVLELRRDVAEQRVRKQINKLIRDLPDAKFIGAAYISLEVEDIWPLLEEASKNKIAQFILSGPTKEVIAILEDASKRSELLNAIRARVAKLNLDELSEAITGYALKSEAIPKALELFTSVTSWIRANEVAEKVVMPLLPYLSRADVEAIILAPKQKGADLPGSSGFTNFLRKVKELRILPVSELVQMLSDNDLEHYATLLQNEQT